MKWGSWLGVSALALGLILVGCGKNGGSESGEKRRGPRVYVLNVAGLDSLLLHRNGRVLVLNVWATWCGPCREEFPDIIRVAREFERAPVDFIGLSVDYPDEIEKKVKPLVRELGIPFSIFVQDFPRQEDLINRLSPDWSGAIPTTFIYDAKGRLRTFLLGKQSYESLKEALRRVLKEEGARPDPGQLNRQAAEASQS